MITMLISIYRAWPLRPHCSPARHVRLCTWLGMAGTRCPAKDA